MAKMSRQARNRAASWLGWPARTMWRSAYGPRHVERWSRGRPPDDGSSPEQPTGGNGASG